MNSPGLVKLTLTKLTLELRVIECPAASIALGSSAVKSGKVASSLKVKLTLSRSRAERSPSATTVTTALPFKVIEPALLKFEAWDAVNSTVTPLLTVKFLTFVMVIPVRSTGPANVKL